MGFVLDWPRGRTVGREMKIVIAGILGGIAMFVWTSIAHVALPLGQIGFSQIPHESSVLSGLHESIGASSGLYFFPWTDMKSKNAVAEEAAKMKANPSGLLIYRPPGAVAMTNSTLAIELVKEIIVAIIAAFLLSLAILPGYLPRVGFVALVGIVATLTTNASYWNWYSFPGDYTLAAMTTDVVGYLAAGFVIAGVLKRRTSWRPMAVSAA